MKKYMDKFIKKVCFNKNLFVFLLSFILIGVVSGSFFSLFLNDSDRSLVTNYLNDFMVSLSSNKLKLDISFYSTFVFTLGYALLIWILGISILGVLFILPFLFIKSFVLGFSIGSIIINFKLKGVIIAFTYIFPHQLINIFTYILISGYAITVSYRVFRCVKDKKSLDFKKIMNKYSFILTFCLIVLFLTSLYESVLLPKVMSFVVSLLK